ncbi:MAG: hypothetical protein H5T82_03795 [Demequina sp.]|uniref:hypothetical protein n=1 Tax=Demequina sp. TaxID=2050685 RepID=UPI00199EBB75|nr:hypothetical protein [Demequina sp.]MBC7297997.1 hypothetical protein [Demequina sp.]
MNTDDATADEVLFSTLVNGRRPWLSAVAAVAALIGVSAAAWWGAWSLWAGRRLPDLALPSPRPFALGAGVAMIAATELAHVTHMRQLARVAHAGGATPRVG